MRRIKKQFNYSNVTITNLDTNEVTVKKVSGKVTKKSVMTEYMKENDFSPLDIKIEPVTEVRVMSAETFIANSEILEVPQELEETEEA